MADGLGHAARVEPAQPGAGQLDADEWPGWSGRIQRVRMAPTLRPAVRWSAPGAGSWGVPGRAHRGAPGSQV
ncbi:MAG: hypothetical protein MI924_32030 [Chloroflexales bacterium]|nr:hypothetical protein [Chloroflexales bacterium]